LWENCQRREFYEILKSRLNEIKEDVILGVVNFDSAIEKEGIAWKREAS
jgi:hypothetical protein